MPGARILWTVTMKFSPVRIDEKPETHTPIAARMTCVFEYVELNGAENVQAVSTPPRTMAVIAKIPPTIYIYQVNRLKRGNARSLAPTMGGTRTLPRVA